MPEMSTPAIPTPVLGQIANLQERLAAKEEECTLLAASLRKTEAERDAALEALQPFAEAYRSGLRNNHKATYVTELSAFARAAKACQGTLKQKSPSAVIAGARWEVGRDGSSEDDPGASQGADS
jgi:hypothetical protein